MLNISKRHLSLKHHTVNRAHSNLSIMEFKHLKLLLLVLIPCANGAIPGTFFWKPRLGIDLAIPTTEVTMNVAVPDGNNIREGLVVLIDGYQVGLTIVAMAAGVSNAKPFPHMNPTSAYFYTNSYRWALRHLSLMPFWLGGNGGSYCDTHKIWRRRFFYMDELLPKWMRKIFPYVDDKEWKKEEKELKRFKKFSESAFGKHYRFPSKKFNNFKSQETKESLELLDASSLSVDD